MYLINGRVNFQGFLLSLRVEILILSDLRRGKLASSLFSERVDDIYKSLAAEKNSVRKQLGNDKYNLRNPKVLYSRFCYTA